MHNRVAHHTLTDAQAAIVSCQPTPPVYLLGMTFHGIEYPFGHTGLPISMPPPSFLQQLLTGRPQGTAKSSI